MYCMFENSQRVQIILNVVKDATTVYVLFDSYMYWNAFIFFFFQFQLQTIVITTLTPESCMYIRVKRFWSLVYPDPLVDAKLDSKTYLCTKYVLIYILRHFGSVWLKIFQKVQIWQKIGIKKRGILCWFQICWKTSEKMYLLKAISKSIWWLLL